MSRTLSLLIPTLILFHLCMYIRYPLKLILKCPNKNSDNNKQNTIKQKCKVTRRSGKQEFLLCTMCYCSRRRHVFLLQKSRGNIRQVNDVVYNPALVSSYCFDIVVVYLRLVDLVKWVSFLLVKHIILSISFNVSNTCSSFVVTLFTKD